LWIDSRDGRVGFAVKSKLGSGASVCSTGGDSSIWVSASAVVKNVYVMLVATDAETL
jgi:hypothetical protein